METTHPITCQAARKFALAGNAHLTFKNVEKGTRRTFQIVKSKKNEQIFYVKVLTGPENTRDYTYLGTLKVLADGTVVYKHGRTSTISATAQANVAFDWVWNKVIIPNHKVKSLEIWHEGRCCRCGRLLTTPESVAAGIGPECQKYLI